MIMQQLMTSCAIQLLTIAVMAGPLLALASSSSPGPQRNQMFFELLPLNDVNFSENLLLEVWARSRIECSKKCVETEGCVMCTFHSIPEDRPPGLCRLHSQLQKGTDVQQRKTGARSMACSRPCAEGYVLSCCHCLKAVNENEIYPNARHNCHTMRARLVMPKSAAQAACMSSFLQASGLGAAWVGADDLLIPTVFLWSDGTLLPDNSSLWNSQTSDPHHRHAGLDCIAFTEGHPSLQDQSCFKQYPYVCQRDNMI